MTRTEWEDKLVELHTEISNQIRNMKAELRTMQNPEDDYVISGAVAKIRSYCDIITRCQDNKEILLLKESELEEEEQNSEWFSVNDFL